MLNHQMHDLDINKLTSLACVQQTFPNDNLNLFENISNKVLFDEQVKLSFVNQLAFS